MLDCRGIAQPLFRQRARGAGRPAIRTSSRLAAVSMASRVVSISFLPSVVRISHMLASADVKNVTFKDTSIVRLRPTATGITSLSYEVPSGFTADLHSAHLPSACVQKLPGEYLEHYYNPRQSLPTPTARSAQARATDRAQVGPEWHRPGRGRFVRMPSPEPFGNGPSPRRGARGLPGGRQG